MDKSAWFNKIELTNWSCLTFTINPLHLLPFEVLIINQKKSKETISIAAEKSEDQFTAGNAGDVMKTNRKYIVVQYKGNWKYPNK